MLQDYNEKEDHKGFKHRIHRKIICDQENLLASSAVVQQHENGHLAKQQVETQVSLPPHSIAVAAEVTPVSRVQSSDVGRKGTFRTRRTLPALSHAQVQAAQIYS